MDFINPFMAIIAFKDIFKFLIFLMLIIRQIQTVPKNA